VACSEEDYKNKYEEASDGDVMTESSEDEIEEEGE
jgi:hypothetical protein